MPSHRDRFEACFAYRFCCLFWTVFSRTGAEKLFGLSEPAPQIPDRELRRLWLWFDPSALGVNVDRTPDTPGVSDRKVAPFLTQPRQLQQARTRVHLSGPGRVRF